jgi:hypothetical protein
MIKIRIPSILARDARIDLLRKNKFAHERVGYLAFKAARLTDGDILLCAHHYFPVADENYICAPGVGALINGAALREAMQFAYSEQSCMFHTHLHPHSGVPQFSRYDLQENHKFVPDLFNVAPGLPHGAFLFSHDAARALVWRTAKGGAEVAAVTEVGAPLRTWAPA